VRMASIYALGWRGDASAIPALESLLKSDDLSIEMVPMIHAQIAKLKKPAGEKPSARGESEEADDEGEVSSGKNGETSDVTQRLEKLERLAREMNERLKAIESRLPPVKSGAAAN